MGVDGAKTVIVNSVGREIRELTEDSKPPVTGHPMQLTIDADVQKATEDGFETSGFDGAAVVLDPRNGEVLAFTSRPAFDPNSFAAGIDRTTWNSLINDPLKPLNNRALQGTFSPGSTRSNSALHRCLKCRARSSASRANFPSMSGAS